MRLHRCYNVVDTHADNKCYISGCPNYLREALLGGSATDARLKSALVDQKGCAQRKGRPSWVLHRLQSEIDFLPSSTYHSIRRTFLYSY